MNTYNILIWGLRLAGIGQLFIAFIYFWLRRIVDWDADVAKLRPHNRCITHTYARYIQALNTIFGLMCLLQPHELLGKTPLAADVTLLIGVYWLMRVVLALFYYDTREITQQRQLFRFGEWAFNLLFAYIAAVMLAAFAFNVGWLKA